MHVFWNLAQDLADESQKFSEHSTATAPVVIDYEPDSYVLEENEERSMIEPQSKNDPKLKNIIQVNHVPRLFHGFSWGFSILKF